jgi:sirohydrochlorin cobaltochelatase
MSKSNKKAKVVIVLAMHGAPPLDFPRPELTEFLSLHARIGHGEGPAQAAGRAQYKELEARVLAWPRTPQNDPFHAGSLDLAGQLRRASGLEVILGFNEFCSPTLDEALEQAGAHATEKVIVITPMMIRGGEHSAVEIPEAIQRARNRHPAIQFLYVWPFDSADIARFLASQVSRFLESAR